MKNKLVFIGLFLLLVISLVSADTFVYDDFSSRTLDQQKWLETSAINLFVSDFYVKDEGGYVYHTAQTTHGSGDHDITLILNRDFNSGESLEYDIFYDTGYSLGNRMSRLYFNDNSGLPQNELYLDTRLRAQGYNNGGFATSGNIGYWNGDSEVGNIAGLYHIKIDFESSNANIIIINPNQQIYKFRININAPVKFGVSSRTGSDGELHFDYDNFIITTPTSAGGGGSGGGSGSEPNTTWMYYKILELDEKLISLESRFDKQQEELNDLKEQLKLNQTENEQKIQDLTLRVEKLENNTYNKTEINSKLATINSKISRLETGLKKVETQIMEILKRLSTRLWPRLW